jgi:hypothetical protein
MTDRQPAPSARASAFVDDICRRVSYIATLESALTAIRACDAQSLTSTVGPLHELGLRQVYADVAQAATAALRAIEEGAVAC